RLVPAGGRSGTASLAGNVALLFSPRGFARRYRILSAAGGLGGPPFNAVTTVNAPANFTANLRRTPTHRALNPTALRGQGAGLSQNQQNVATALNVFFNSGGTLPANFLSIFNLSGAVSVTRSLSFPANPRPARSRSASRWRASSSA